MNILAVALGGGIGAALRYGLSLLPISREFPMATLLTNFLGAFLIGLIAAQAGRLSTRSVLLLKTGICGGFTTFSTFSLETVMLLPARNCSGAVARRSDREIITNRVLSEIAQHPIAFTAPWRPYSRSK